MHKTLSYVGVLWYDKCGPLAHRWCATTYAHVLTLSAAVPFWTLPILGTSLVPIVPGFPASIFAKHGSKKKKERSYSVAADFTLHTIPLFTRNVYRSRNIVMVNSELRSSSMPQPLSCSHAKNGFCPTLSYFCPPSSADYSSPSCKSGTGVTFLTTLAGDPMATENSGISLVTMLPAPIVHPFPIVTPAMMVTVPPIQQSSPIVTDLAYSMSSRRDWTSVSCVAAKMETLGPNMTLLPMVTRPQSRIHKLGRISSAI